MSNLTSTVPGAFAAFYNLLEAAGAAQNPAVPVLHSSVGQYEPDTYVLLESVENHAFEIAALGSYAQYETYDLCGYASCFQAGEDPLTLTQDVLAQTWAAYQAVVMSTLVANRGANGQAVLGLTNPETLVYVTPGFAHYRGQPDPEGRGFFGRIDFSYALKARITV